MAKKKKVLASAPSSNGRKVSKSDLTNVRTGLRDAFKKSEHRKHFVNKHKIKTPKYTAKGNLHKVPDISYKCNDCEAMLKGAEIRVDHVIPVGAFKDATHIDSFFFRIFCGYDNLQILCDDCHDHKTIQDRKDIKADNQKANKEREGVHELRDSGQRFLGLPTFEDPDLSIGELSTLNGIDGTDSMRLVDMSRGNATECLENHIHNHRSMGHDVKAIHCYSVRNLLDMMPNPEYPVETKTVFDISSLI